MFFSSNPTPAPAPERVARPLCAIRTGLLWLPGPVGGRWSQHAARDIRGFGWVMDVVGPIPQGLPEVGSMHEVDLGDHRFARGFVVVTKCHDNVQL